MLRRGANWVLDLFGFGGQLLHYPEADRQTPAPPRLVSIPASTGEQPVATVDGISIFRRGSTLVYFDSDLQIDYDGAPNAYAPEGFGQPLDHLANAGKNGKWWGLATDQNDLPLVQGEGEPYPGYYISTTALTWPGQQRTARYVDSTAISFLSLPPVFTQLGAKLGDLAMVQSTKTGRQRFAIWADVGPKSKLGEGSLKLAQELGATSAALRESGINVVLYLGSGDGHPRTEDEIQRAGAQLAQGVA